MDEEKRQEIIFCQSFTLKFQNIYPDIYRDFLKKNIS